MGERLIDNLARALAEPMPRRHAVRLLGVTLVAAAVPGMRPGLALGRRSACDLGCGDNVRACPRVVSGGTGPPLCCGSPATRYICGGTPAAPTCIDTCTGPNDVPCPGARRDFDGCIDFICCKKPDRCVNRTCEPVCPPERSGCGLCCAAGQYCDRARNMCCNPDPSLVCRGPEKRCKAAADFAVEEYERESCSKSRSPTKNIHYSFTTGKSVGSHREEAANILGCFAYAEAVMRRLRYSECRQVADDSLCPAGVSCDERSGLCAKPLCPRNSSLTEAQQAQRGPPEIRSPAARFVSGPPRVRAELRRHEPKLHRDAGQVGRALDRKPTAARRRALASALDRYRRDVEALIRDVEQIGKADASARSAAAATVTTLNHTSSGLSDFADALRASGKSKSISLGKRSRRSFRQAAVSSRKARRVLGCGKEC